MQNRKAKKTSTVILTLTITAIFVTMAIIVAMKVMDRNQKNAQIEQGSTVVTKSRFFNNGWDSKVVAEIRDGDVPIPVGFQYVSGKKDTGLIIENKANKKQYVWIPVVDGQADEKGTSDNKVEQFFQGIDTVASVNRLAEIQKYGGFYAGIASVSDKQAETYKIANMPTEEYEKSAKLAQEKYSTQSSVSASILSPEEAKMLLDFNNQSDGKIKISTEMISNAKKTLMASNFIYFAKNGAVGYEENSTMDVKVPVNFQVGEPLDYLSTVVDDVEYYRVTRITDGKQYRIDSSTVALKAKDVLPWTVVTGDEQNQYVLDTANVYEDSYTGSQVSYTWQKGTQVSVLRKSECKIGNQEYIWYEVQKDSEVGFMLAGYLSKDANENNPSAEEKARYTIRPSYAVEEPAPNQNTLQNFLVANEFDPSYLQDTKTVNGVEWAYVSNYPDGGPKGYVLASTLGTVAPEKVYQEKKSEKADTIFEATDTFPMYIACGSGENHKITDIEKGDQIKISAEWTRDNETWYEIFAVKYSRYGFVSADEIKAAEKKSESNPEDGKDSGTPADDSSGNKPGYTGETITITPGESDTNNSDVPDKWKEHVDAVVNGIPIPKGFEMQEGFGTDAKTGFVIRQKDTLGADNTYRLCYVWVPVDKTNNEIESLDKAKEELNKVYKILNKVTTTSDNATETLPTELLASVKEYGGFYIAQGELGYDNQAKLYNRPRGMRKYSNGWYGVDLGNYFRFVTESARKDSSSYVDYTTAMTKYDKIMESMTLEKIKKICQSEELQTEYKSVTSHLTYGAEWDAAMIWILKQDERTESDLTQLLITDSSPIGKYRGGLFNAKLLNSTWGFAGNLAEVTQEKTSDGKIIVRGGSYADSGIEYPIASRAGVEETKIQTGDNYGFRNCLYINLSK